MAASTPLTQDTMAMTLNAEFGNPIQVSTMLALSQFPFLQTLGFDGCLKDSVDTYHGLDDFNDQMDVYSSTDLKTLTPAWNTIKQVAPINPQVRADIYVDPTLGEVGDSFMIMAGAGQTFSVSMGDLKTNIMAAADKVAGS